MPPANTAVLQNAGKCRRQVVAAHREVFAPRKIEPAPSIEPAVMPALVRPDRSMVPAAPLMKRAVPPVLELTNSTADVVGDGGVAGRAGAENSRTPLLVMVALPAVLVSRNAIRVVVGDGGAAGRAGAEEIHDQLLLVMVALPAVLVPRNCRSSLLVMVALPAVLVLRNCRPRCCW